MPESRSEIDKRKIYDEAVAYFRDLSRGIQRVFEDLSPEAQQKVKETQSETERRTADYLARRAKWDSNYRNYATEA